MEASPQQPNFVEVCSVEDLWEGEMQCFRVRNSAILLLKLDGRFRAYQGRCPHQGVALVEGDFDMPCSSLAIQRLEWRGD
jgi:nitrite reductase/ring-hydroxylating ferredoxin subunit